MASTLPPLQQPLHQIPTPMSSGAPTPSIPGAYGPVTGDTPGLEATSMYENWEKMTSALNQVATNMSQSFGMGAKEPMPEPRSPEAWKHEASSDGPNQLLERSKTLSANAANATANAAKNVLPTGVATSLGLTQPIEPVSTPQGNKEGFEELPKTDLAGTNNATYIEQSKELVNSAGQTLSRAATRVLPAGASQTLGLGEPIEPTSTPQGNKQDFEELPKVPPPGLAETNTTTTYVDQSKSMTTSAGQTLSNAATSVLPVGVSHSLGLGSNAEAANTETTSMETPTQEKDMPQSQDIGYTRSAPPSKGLQTASEFVAATKHLPPDTEGPPISTVTGDPITAKTISPDADVQEAASNSPHDFTTTIPGHETSTTRQEMLGGPEVRPSTGVERSPKTTVKIIAAETQHPTVGYSRADDSEGSTPIAPNKPLMATQPTVASLSSTAAVVGSSRNSTEAPSSSSASYSPVSPQVHNKHMAANIDRQQHSRGPSSDSSSESPASPSKSAHSRTGSAGKVSLKNKLKGEFKVVKGKMKKDEELVQEGRMLKSGLIPS